MTYQLCAFSHILRGKTRICIVSPVSISVELKKHKQTKLCLILPVRS